MKRGDRIEYIGEKGWYINKQAPWILVELVRPNGHDGNMGGYRRPYNYRRHSKLTTIKNCFYYCVESEVKLYDPVQDEVNTEYQAHSTRKRKSSMKVGNVWITPVVKRAKP